MTYQAQNTDILSGIQAYTHTDMHECMNACIHENTVPGVFYSPSENDLFELCRLYEGCIGQSINNASAAILEEWFEKMEPALIREAVKRTGLYARRPGAPYIRAILRNWDSQGIHSMEQLQTKEKTRIQTERAASAMRSNWWNTYQERNLTANDYGKHSYTDPTKDLI